MIILTTNIIIIIKICTVFGRFWLDLRPILKKKQKKRANRFWGKINLSSSLTIILNILTYPEDEIKDEEGVLEAKLPAA